MDDMIESALEPGSFIGWNEGCALFRTWGCVDREIAKLVASKLRERSLCMKPSSQPCNAKADEVDDSDGEFGTFARGLYCGWIAARQAADVDRSQTARLLLEWIDNDSYGFSATIWSFRR
ncbi:MAG TPA: hypothetical protein VGL82_06595 [Bryobacteraceae bacterium]|jgi:hypothetical protein